MRPAYIGVVIAFSSHGEAVDRHGGRLRDLQSNAMWSATQVKNAWQGSGQPRNLERSRSRARRGRGPARVGVALFGARKHAFSAPASASAHKLHRVVSEIGQSRLRRADGANA